MGYLQSRESSFNSRIEIKRTTGFYKMREGKERIHFGHNIQKRSAYNVHSLNIRKLRIEFA